MRVRGMAAMMAMILGTVASGASAQDAGSEPVFISPMGEPFRGTAGGLPQDRWFAQADLNHDGKLSIEEMRKDAARFFATLDKNHDGEIDPDELYAYENDVAPEIAAVMMTGGTYHPTESVDNDTTAKDENGYPIIRTRDVVGGKHGRRRERIATSYLGLREPVRAADTNLNQGVSLAEFDAAAQARFHQLDNANQAFLTPAELKPQLR